MSIEFKRNQSTHLPETASQTAGPYVHIGLAPHQARFDIFEKKFGKVLVTPTTEGERIHIEGRIFDGSGTPVPDVLIEIWQANAAGRYAHEIDQQDKNLDEAFRGWGRACSDFETSLYSFETIKPGSVVGRNGRVMAPHINFWIVARGINIGLSTRMYFSDEAAPNNTGPVLTSIEWEVRRKTLIAQRGERDGKATYTFDLYLQGQNETVFFDV